MTVHSVTQDELEQLAFDNHPAQIEPHAHNTARLWIGGDLYVSRGAA